MLVVGLLDPVVDGHRPAWTVAILAAAPVGDVLVVIAANFVVSITVKDKRRAAALGWHERYRGHSRSVLAILTRLILRWFELLLVLFRELDWLLPLWRLATCSTL